MSDNPGKRTNGNEKRINSGAASFHPALKLFLTVNTVLFVLITVACISAVFRANIKPAAYIAFFAAVLSVYLIMALLFALKIYKPVSEIENNLGNMFTRINESMNREYTAEILKRQAEFSALQSQINPHFLYNTLDSIRGEALMKGAEEIAEMTEALSTFFRYSISQKGDFVTLEDELKNVENYFIIQQYRFSNKFTFSIKYDDDIDILEYRLPKLTIQPIVENSIYHGLETKIGKGAITIRITTTARRLIINISDDGTGMDRATLDRLSERLDNCTGQPRTETGDRHTGIALINVNQRIKLFFGEQYGITVSSTPSLGTSVEIVMPLIKGDSVIASGGCHEA